VQPELIRAVDAMGWLLPTPIQAEAIPLILGGGDVMGAAETGRYGALPMRVFRVKLKR
jgi:ATP-dependent RNA helicase DDX1